jgi:hypothetical protein
MCWSNQSGQMKLIDYDGMCVPSLANRYVMEGGHLNYQHPARSLHFDLNLDAFSALVILTALTALSLQPGLWNEFNHGNNLLFHESDFKAPEVSRLFQVLHQLKDPRLTHLLHELATACTTKQADSPETLRRNCSAPALKFFPPLRPSANLRASALKSFLRFQHAVVCNMGESFSFPVRTILASNNLLWHTNLKINSFTATHAYNEK